MKKYNQQIELIIQTKTSPVEAKSMPIDFIKKLKVAGIDAEMETEQKKYSKKQTLKGKHFLTTKNNVTLKTNAKDTEINPWDIAHLSADALGKNSSYIEPNFFNEFTVDRKVNGLAKDLNSKSFKGGKSDDGFDPDWKPNKNIVWHLDDAHSQLMTARNAVANIDYNICIGHLDTGYSKTHFAIPDEIRKNKLQRNFVQGENQNDSHDPFSDGFLKNPGHGTGTLGLLAGTKIDIAVENGRFQDYLGAAFFAEVISCRIAESVALIKTNAFAEALNYLTQLTLSGKQVHVVTMSMGGAPSKIWADAVNAAYEAGITVVTAAGNNFAGLPTRHVIYPARFGRVIAACGVTFDMKPYYTKKLTEMQGCFGPERHMKKALSAFTPNTPWASVESETIRFSGAGTSSATPQIAAAAAIYYRQNHAELDSLQPWQRVEAIRNALYKSAIKKVNDSRYDDDFLNYFGNGIIQAAEALKIPVAKNLKKTEEDEVPWFPILETIFKKVPSEQQKTKLDMFNTELAQLVYNYPELNALVDNEKVSKAKWEKFKDAVISHPATSVTLKKYLKERK